MRKALLFSLGFAGILSSSIPCVSQLPGMPPPPHYAWSDASQAPDTRADLVLQQMTLDEKLLLLHGQGMAFLWTGPTESNGGAGYTRSIPRLGIPSIQMADSAYGVTRSAANGRYSTALPSDLGAASSWNPELLYQYGALIGKELRAQGYSMTLGGGINLAREPRDGRTFEYLGEDPLLAGTLGGNLAKGAQSEHIIGDLKHYAVNDQESGRTAANAIISRRAMRETDLRAVQIALGISDAGGVMCAYNRVNGVFACENDYLLHDVLKSDFQFKGFVLSDWGATHSTVASSHAGLDMEQPMDTFYGAALGKAVESGTVSEAELNEHVHRVLRTIFASGLFDHPVTRNVPDVVGGAMFAQKVAEQSIVLLRNDHDLLPLSPKVKSVVLIGGHADVGVLSGGGSGQVDAPGGSPVPAPAPHDLMSFFVQPQYLPSSPLHALQAAMPGVQISYVSGDDLPAAESAAKAADVAIVFGTQWEAESFDLPTLDLPSKQNQLISSVAAANSKTVVVLENGGPVVMPWVDRVAGVVETWYPGIRGGEALAAVLTGAVNPTGKLAISFPQSDADLPHPHLVLPPKESQPDMSKLGGDISTVMSQIFQALPPFDVNYDEGLKVGYAWYQAEHKPMLFPFGFGLSYTTYRYSALEVEPGETTIVRFRVKNTGKRAGTETAQVYASLPAMAGEPPRRLVGWNRVELQPGQEKQVLVSVPRDSLTIFNEGSNGWSLVPGEYAMSVGGSSEDLPLVKPTSF